MKKQTTFLKIYFNLCLYQSILFLQSYICVYICLHIYIYIYIYICICQIINLNSAATNIYTNIYFGVPFNQTIPSVKAERDHLQILFLLLTL